MREVTCKAKTWHSMMVKLVADLTGSLEMSSSKRMSAALMKLKKVKGARGDGSDWRTFVPEGASWKQLVAMYSEGTLMNVSPSLLVEAMSEVEEVNSRV